MFSYLLHRSSKKNGAIQSGTHTAILLSMFQRLPLFRRKEYNIFTILSIQNRLYLQVKFVSIYLAGLNKNAPKAPRVSANGSRRSTVYEDDDEAQSDVIQPTEDIVFASIIEAAQTIPQWVDEIWITLVKSLHPPAANGV